MSSTDDATRYTLSEAVRIEHEATLRNPGLYESPEAVLVRLLAGQLDAARDAAAVKGLSQEFRAATEALRESVLRAGKRGDAVDDLASKRAARRGAGAANPDRPRQRKQRRD